MTKCWEKSWNVEILVVVWKQSATVAIPLSQRNHTSGSVLVTRKEMISLLAHKHIVVISISAVKWFSRKKNTQTHKSGFIQNKMTGNGQIHPRAVKRMYVVLQIHLNKVFCRGYSKRSSLFWHNNGNLHMLTFLKIDFPL